jgi:Flp pilus assembly pilin Flp
MSWAMTDQLKYHLRCFLNADKGAVAIEYAIISVAMFLAIVPGFFYVSTAVQQKLFDIGSYFAG